jgi:hypothetical protein
LDRRGGIYIPLWVGFFCFLLIIFNFYLQGFYYIWLWHPSAFILVHCNGLIAWVAVCHRDPSFRWLRERVAACLPQLYLPLWLHKVARWTWINAPIAPPAITPAKPEATEEPEIGSVEDPVTVPLSHENLIYNRDGCFKSFSGFYAHALLWVSSCDTYP